MVKRNRIDQYKLNMLKSSGESLVPKRAIFYPTLNCNLKCAMCFQKNHNRREPLLTLAEIKEIFAAIELDSILLVGGEIFTRKDFMEVTKYFCSRYPEVILQTNATLLTNKIIEELNQLEQVKDIWISIDGMKATHEKIRGKGTFDKALDAIRKLSIQKNIYINTVMMEDNINELQEIYDFFNYENVKAINYQFQMTYSTQQFQESVSELTQNGLATAIFDDCVTEKSKELSFKKGMKGMVRLLRNNEHKAELSFYPEIFEKEIDAYFQGNILNSGTIFCQDLLDSVLKINHRGELMLCEVMNTSFGNLREESLSKLWNSKKIMEYRKKLTNNKMIKLCSRCCCISKI